MKKQSVKTLQKLITVARGDGQADLVLKNCRICDVFNQQIIGGDIAIVDGLIAGIGGRYKGKKEINCRKQYAVPGFIDGHIHIESSYLCQEEFGRLVTPLGTTSIIADPHEIVNVCGLKGLKYMVKAAAQTALHVEYMLPSCVPSTPFEDAGAVIAAKDMEEPLASDAILGLGEFMNAPGVINCDKEVLAKLHAAQDAGKIIDGHSPGLLGKGLMAYASAGIQTDHECYTLQEMQERLALGMYVMLRNGSAAENLPELIKGVTAANIRHCLLCSDDLHPKTIFDHGHINYDLKYCVQQGLDPLAALTMATINPAECYGLKDRGALTPGRRADIVILPDLTNFQPSQTWIDGRLVAEKGHYLLPEKKYSIKSVSSSVRVKKFSEAKLQLNLKNNHVNTIDLVPGQIITKKGKAKITLDEQGDFVFNPKEDVVKVAVVERHHNTGTVGLGLMRGYGLKAGAIAVTIAHDSHNIIVAGANNEDMVFAVERLVTMGGGMVAVKDQKVLADMPLPIAGLMSDKDGKWVDRHLQKIHDKAFNVLGVSREVDPIMTLCFMSLPVIPSIKLTNRGLFDVDKFAFMPLT